MSDDRVSGDRVSGDLVPVQPTTRLPAESAPPPRTLWERVNPTEPERWVRVREGGRSGVIVRYGIPFIGLPGAIVLDVLIALRNAVRYHHGLSFLHGAPLVLFTLFIGSALGFAGGKWIWNRGERRLKDEAIKEAFKRAPPEWREGTEG